MRTYIHKSPPPCSHKHLDPPFLPFSLPSSGFMCITYTSPLLHAHGLGKFRCPAPTPPPPLPPKTGGSLFLYTSSVYVCTRLVSSGLQYKTPRPGRPINKRFFHTSAPVLDRFSCLQIMEKNKVKHRCGCDSEVHLAYVSIALHTTPHTHKEGRKEGKILYVHTCINFFPPSPF